MADKEVFDILSDENNQTLAASELIELTEAQAKEIEKYKPAPTGA